MIHSYFAFLTPAQIFNIFVLSLDIKNYTHYSSSGLTGENHI